MKYVGCLLLLVMSCQVSDVPSPRPHQYPRLTFPEREYKIYKNEECPFTMEVPSASEVVKKEYLFGEIEASPCWFDISISSLAATVHCSYYKINQDQRLDKLINDAFTMASKHNIKASYREEFEIKTREASGMIFKINGPVATPYQFYISDSTNHFFRGSLYFDAKVDYDSIAPVVTFLEKEVDHMLRSLVWKE